MPERINKIQGCPDMLAEGTDFLTLEFGAKRQLGDNWRESPSSRASSLSSSRRFQAGT